MLPSFPDEAPRLPKTAGTIFLPPTIFSSRPFTVSRSLWVNHAARVGGLTVGATVRREKGLDSTGCNSRVAADKAASLERWKSLLPSIA